MACTESVAMSSDVDHAVDISGLLTPLWVNSLRLPNRFALAPMTRYATPDGVPTAQYPGYFRRRAAGGMGLLITESTLIPEPSTAMDLDMASFFRDEAATAWKAVVDEVHEEGAAIFSQLLHAGVYRGPSPAVFPGVPTASPSGIDFYGDPVWQALSVNDIDRIIGNYVAAARAARRAGFDGIEVHSAASRSAELTKGHGVDRVVEVGGPATINQSLRAVAIGGEVTLIGFLSDANPGIDYFLLKRAGAITRSITVGDRSDSQELVRAVTATGLQPVIDRTFEFDDAPAAFRRLADAKHLGKLVISVN